MSKINIGQSNGKNVSIDLDTLLSTRLLIQASSGAGKSWAIRRIIEQAFGKVQIILIDLEGEAHTLREKFDFVLVGKGGETPADIRSAELVARKMLELGASCICDLYELPPHARHEWVERFLSAMINAPKNLWHSVLVIVDEAHVFCPEKGQSRAANAMIDLATRGRKRGFGCCFATQRLSKLNKDAAAEMTNVMIGRTFMDIDRDRAIECLGIARKDQSQFNADIRTLSDGEFFSLGRAISTEVIRVKVGSVETNHPKAGSRQGAPPAPPTAKIRHLLPQLADLPKEAEEKAKTEKELREEIRRLEREVKSKPVADNSASAKELAEAKAEIRKYIKVVSERDAIIERMRSQAAKIAGIELPTISVAKVASGPPVVPIKPVPISRPVKQVVESNGTLSGPEQRIIDAIAWLEDLGIETPQQVAVAFLAGYTFGGGAFNNPRGALRTKGYVDYVGGDGIRLTDEGRAHAAHSESPLTTEDLQAAVLTRLPGPEQRILKVLIDVYPESLPKEECASRAGYAMGGAFNNPLGRLRSLGLIEYPAKGHAVAQNVLFLG